MWLRPTDIEQQPSKESCPARKRCQLEQSLMPTRRLRCTATATRTPLSMNKLTVVGPRFDEAYGRPAKRRAKSGGATNNFPQRSPERFGTPPAESTDGFGTFQMQLYRNVPRKCGCRVCAALSRKKAYPRNGGKGKKSNTLFSKAVRGGRVY